jgi:hypothetical protein
MKARKICDLQRQVVQAKINPTIERATIIGTGYLQNVIRSCPSDTKAVGVEKLSLNDMISLAAYAASKSP